MTSYRGDRARVAIKCLLMFWLVGLPFGLGEGLVRGLKFGLVFGLPVGLVGEAWPAFLLASKWLVVRGRCPWRLMSFLEDAYRLGLLRVVGSAYQFRHAELQDHLAPPAASGHPRQHVESCDNPIRAAHRRGPFR